MKARVKATGEIVEVNIVEVNKVTSCDKDFKTIAYYKAKNGFSYKEEHLDFKDLTQGKADVKEKSFPKDEPDYWDKLHHQAAISAMSAFLIRGCEPEEIAQLSLELAGVMIEKLKNEK